MVILVGPSVREKVLSNSKNVKSHVLVFGKKTQNRGLRILKHWLIPDFKKNKKVMILKSEEYVKCMHSNTGGFQEPRRPNRWGSGCQ